MELLKIQFLRPHREFAYFEGDNATLPADTVERLVRSGHVIFFPGTDQTETNLLPADLPCRDILWTAGFKSTADIDRTSAESLAEIKGVSRKSAEAIKKQLRITN